MPRKRLGELLIDAGLLDRGQLRSALHQQRRVGKPLGHLLVQLGLVEEPALVDALAEQLHLPRADLDSHRFDEEALAKLDATFCQQHGCVPLRLDSRGDRLDVAFADPTVAELLDLINVKTRCVVSPHVAGPTAIDRAIRHVYLGESRTPQTSMPRRRPPTGPTAAPAGWQAVDPASHAVGLSRSETGPALPIAAPMSGQTGPDQPAVGAARCDAARDSWHGTASQDLSNHSPALQGLADEPRAAPPHPAIAARRAPAAAPNDAPAASPRRAPTHLPEPSPAEAQLSAQGHELAQLREAVATLRQETRDLRDLLRRDEDVLQRLLVLLVDAQICSRDELLARLYDDNEGDR